MKIKQKLLPKNWFIIRMITAGKFSILSGSYKLFNKAFIEKLELNMNSGDSYLIYTESEVICEYSESTVELENILNNPLPVDWLSLKIDIRPVLKNRIIVLGASDSGKTTLIKFLALNLPKIQDKIAIIDVDVGQNSLGLPGTINLSEFTSNGIVNKRSAFFGNISPAHNQNLFLQIVKEFFLNIQSLEYSWLFIDTSGYIQTNEAIEIKNGLLSIFKPQIVLLVGPSASELKQKLHARNITYMAISSAISGIKKEKSPELRRRKRNERFLEYFKNSHPQECSFEKINLIQVNYDNEMKILDSKEEIKYFLETNIVKLVKLFIAIENTSKDEIFYAIIQEITNETLLLTIPDNFSLSNTINISIGSIYLDIIKIKQIS